MNEELFTQLLEDKEQKIYRYFTGKSWEKSTSGKLIPVISPHDQTVVGSLQAVTPEEANRVVTEAKKAQREWENVSLDHRIEVVKKAAEILRENESVYTNILVSEIGKTKHESKSEVLRTADLIEMCTSEVLAMKNYSIPSELFPGFKKGIVSHVEHVAHGVVLAIGPFNYPINLVASKIAPALLMGNAVVVKPPTQGSISGLLLTQAFFAAGLPEGVISCVTGEGREIGDYLTTHPLISMIAFTGSSGVGQAIAKKVGMKPLLFECGGNNPVIVLPDADMNLTSKEIVKGGFSYAGQRCTGIKYVLGTTATLELLLPTVLEQMKIQIHVGDPTDETTKLVGPVISVKAAEEIEAVIQEAVSQGAQIAVGGKRTGAYMEPTILTNVSFSMRVVREETFGPVISFINVNNPEEALSIIDASEYGLQTSIFTQDEQIGIALAKSINVGTVQINGSPQRGPDHFPFMGVKASGLGVQGIRYSLEAMSRLKSIVTNNPI